MLSRIRLLQFGLAAPTFVKTISMFHICRHSTFVPIHPRLLKKQPTTGTPNAILIANPSLVKVSAVEWCHIQFSSWIVLDSKILETVPSLNLFWGFRCNCIDQ